MSNVIVWQINGTTGHTRVGGIGKVYLTMELALAAAEALADDCIIESGGTKVVNETSNRVYVITESVVEYEAGLQPGDSAGDGVTLAITRQNIMCEWWCVA